MAVRATTTSLYKSASYAIGARLRQRCISHHKYATTVFQQSLAVPINHMKTREKPSSLLKTWSTQMSWSHRLMSSSLQPVHAVSCSVKAEDRMLQVSWSHGEDCSYPFVWLRDVCQCPKCWHASADARILLMDDLDINCQIDKAEINEDKKQIEVTWTDGHVSPYPFGWLEERSFTDRCHQKRWHKINQKPIIWDNAAMQTNVPTADFQQVMEDDDALLHWISELELKGIFLLKNTPCKEDQILDLAKRVGHIRTTNYGHEFTVKSKADPSNLAYTSATLGFHTDLSYYDYVPGMQMLHCIKQIPTKGGENQFVDGFHIANLLRETDPEAFQILSTDPVDNYDIGTDYIQFHLVNRRPVISLNGFGELEQISYNNQARDSFLTLPVEKVNPLFRAMKKFNDLCYDPKNYIQFKMEAGDIACFHNYRVLHARTGYEVLESGERHLQGGYIDWDVLYSRRRVILDKLAAAKA